MLRVLTVCLLLSILACGEASDTTTGAKIAALDGEPMYSAYADRADFLLGKIARWCPDDVSEERVGDMALTTRNMLRDDHGIDMDILEVLEEVDVATPDTQPALIPCPELFALYATIAGQ